MRVLSTIEHKNNCTIKDDHLLTDVLYTQKFHKTHKGEDTSRFCFEIRKQNNDSYQLFTDYYVGIDWVVPNKMAIHIEPKINTNHSKIDILTMLQSVLRYPDTVTEITSLFEIKWNKPAIKIKQQQDYLNPFLIVQYLSILKSIVKKGLKKSYYKVNHNLRGRIKGKLHISKTIKHNHIKQKKLHAYCSYEEFGTDHKENRLLKKTLVFIQKYITSFPHLDLSSKFQEDYDYIIPAFEKVSKEITIQEIQQLTTSAFFKEYKPAIHLAKLILRRFGYTIDNIKAENNQIETPPFWIDMPKLFELYGLGLLKDRYKDKIAYHYKTNHNELDYLLNTDHEKMVIDAKYKPTYSKNEISKDDAWQVSGYARLSNVYKKLQIETNQLIDCLIIYPNQENGYKDLMKVNLKEKTMKIYNNIYMIGIQLPSLTDLSKQQ